MARKYFIISKSNWQGDHWSIRRGAFDNRKEAETAAAQLEAANTGDVKSDSRYAVKSMTDIKRMFGEYWFENVVE